MKTVDVTFQNLDSSEISLTDVSHYFDSDPTKLVAGLRGDGKSPNAFIADTTTANAQVRNEDFLTFFLVCVMCILWPSIGTANLPSTSFTYAPKREWQLAQRLHCRYQHCQCIGEALISCYLPSNLAYLMLI